MKSIFLLLLFFSANTFALEDYKCTITNGVSADAKGLLKEIGDTSVINKVFTVNRRTGNTAGPIRNNGRFLTPNVIDFGSSENSFKVVTTMKNDITTSVYALTIEEFAEGSHKPFVYLWNSYVFYGVCEHF